MDVDKRRPRSLALAKLMKAVGYLTSPETTPGKAFTFWERTMTGAMDKLARNDIYLNFAGRMMEQSFRAQAQVIRAREDMLRAMRMPTASDIEDIRADLRRLNNQVEATSAQLELVIEALEAAARRKDSSE